MKLTILKSDDVECSCGTATPTSADDGLPNFCQGCGKAFAKEAPASTRLPPKRDANTTTVKDDDGDDVAKAVEAMHHVGIGVEHEEIRKRGRERYEGYRHDVLDAPLEKRAPVAATLARMADKLVADFKVDHATAYGLIEKSASGRELLRKAAAEGRARAARV